MVVLQAPVTRSRYLAEIKNLLGMHCRPIYINGPPRATMEQMHDYLGGRRLSEWELYLPAHRTLITVWDDYIALKNGPKAP